MASAIASEPLPAVVESGLKALAVQDFDTAIATWQGELDFLQLTSADELDHLRQLMDKLGGLRSWELRSSQQTAIAPSGPYWRTCLVLLHFAEGDLFATFYVAPTDTPVVAAATFDPDRAKIWPRLQAEQPLTPVVFWVLTENRHLGEAAILTLHVDGMLEFESGLRIRRYQARVQPEEVAVFLSALLDPPLHMALVQRDDDRNLLQRMVDRRIAVRFGNRECILPARPVELGLSQPDGDEVLRTFRASEQVRDFLSSIDKLCKKYFPDRCDEYSFVPLTGRD